jgi:hypothetical protein
LPGPFEEYNEFQKLPKGTLIADYWETYKICSIANENLQPLPFDYTEVRNWQWRNEPLSEKRFYFLNNKNALFGGLKDTIHQFGNYFKFSGIKYNCNGTEVRLYNKVSILLRLMTDDNKIILRQSTTNLLNASEAGSSSGERFEMFPNGPGKIVLKASNGKFVCADQGQNDLIYAKSDNMLEWETFEIIYINPQRISLRSSDGKYVSIDTSLGNVLIANKTNLSEAEVFNIKKGSN